MRQILLISIICFLFSCGKDDDNQYKGYGCVYGVHKLRQVRERIGCFHQEMYACGSNQSCADKVAENLGIPKKDVSFVQNYTNLEFKGTNDCNCPQ